MTTPRTSYDDACICGCGLSHNSSIKAISCERCRETLDSDTYMVRKVWYAGEVIWETELATALREEQALRLEDELLESAQALEPLTFSPFASLKL